MHPNDALLAGPLLDRVLDRPGVGLPEGPDAEGLAAIYPGWSPFRREVSARRDRDDSVVGLAFGHRVEIDADGNVHRTPVDAAGRRRVLVEELGIAPELADRVPQDRPTPPPPGTRTAAGRGTP